MKKNNIMRYLNKINYFLQLVNDDLAEIQGLIFEGKHFFRRPS
jgi:hypothetical protein